MPDPSEAAPAAGCAGLSGGCPDCRSAYLAGLAAMPGGVRVGVCLPCGHKHWPWQPCAGHEWADGCPYEGTDCAAPERVGR